MIMFYSVLGASVLGTTALGALGVRLNRRRCQRCATHPVPWTRGGPVRVVERCADGTAVKTRADGRTWHEDADGYVITYEDAS